MGWAARANAALEVRSYRVRRWTAFEWSENDDAGAAEALRRVREQHLQRSAAVIGRRLTELADQASVTQVRVDGAPQLMFELVVGASDEQDATRRGLLRVERALQTRVPSGMGRKVRLTPPWGKSEAEPV